MEKKDEPKMRRDSFIFYTSWLEGIDGYSFQEQAEIVFALTRYCAYGIEPDLTVPHVKMAYLFNKPSIDKNYQHYLNRLGKTKQEQDDNKEGTKQKQNKNKTRTKQEQKNIKQEQNEKNEVQRLGDDVYDDDDVDVDGDVGGDEANASVKKKIQKEKFIPPTLDDVKAYMQEYVKEKAEKENKYITIGEDDPERFIAHHSAGGWIMSNRKQMKDWKGAVRTWILNHNKWNKDYYEERKNTLLQDDSTLGRFNKLLLRKFPFIVGHMDTLLTENELQRLLSIYTHDQIISTLCRLEDRQDYTRKHTNLMLTIIEWIDKQQEDGTV